jgi:Pyridoxal-phosphate dependent enzyme
VISRRFYSDSLVEFFSDFASCVVHLPDTATLPSLELYQSTFDMLLLRYQSSFHSAPFPKNQFHHTPVMSKSPMSSSIPSPSFSDLPLTPVNVLLAHDLIKPYIHRTPLLTCQTLNNIASTPRQPGGANPKINLYFKCENYQKIGAFKARGAFHAIIRLIEKCGLEEVRKKGVITHSSGTISSLFDPLIHPFPDIDLTSR